MSTAQPKGRYNKGAVLFHPVVHVFLFFPLKHLIKSYIQNYAKVTKAKTQNAFLETALHCNMDLHSLSEMINKAQILQQT